MPDSAGQSGQKWIRRKRLICKEKDAAHFFAARHAKGVGGLFRTIPVHGILSEVRKGKSPEAVIEFMDDYVISKGYDKHCTRRHVLAWCMLAGWLLSAGGMLLVHMQHNPPGICVTRS